MAVQHPRSCCQLCGSWRGPWDGLCVMACGRVSCATCRDEVHTTRLKAHARACLGLAARRWRGPWTWTWSCVACQRHQTPEDWRRHCAVCPLSPRDDDDPEHGVIVFPRVVAPWQRVVLRPWCWFADGQWRGALRVAMAVVLLPHAHARAVRKAIELAEFMRGLTSTIPEHVQLVSDLVSELTKEGADERPVSP